MPVRKCVPECLVHEGARPTISSGSPRAPSLFGTGRAASDTKLLHSASNGSLWRGFQRLALASHGSIGLKVPHGFRGTAQLAQATCSAGVRRSLIRWVEGEGRDDVQSQQVIAQASEAIGFQKMFAPDRLTLGVFFPIEAFSGDEPTMVGQERLARRAEQLGYAGLWVRDGPLRDPSFGDVGQIYDPWVYLGWIAAQTRTIALAAGSIILPLRHPLHVAKAAASVDQLSGGRFVLGIASGDRPVEFPGRSGSTTMGTMPSCFARASGRHPCGLGAPESSPRCRSTLGVLSGTADVVPKPIGRIPILVTGSSPPAAGLDRRECRRLDHLHRGRTRNARPSWPSGLAFRRRPERVQAIRPVPVH